MIKLTASLSKKIPIAGMNYSSQSFLAGLEVELSDAAALPEVQQRIREVYQLLELSINEQITAHQNACTALPGEAPSGYKPANTNSRYDRPRNERESRHNAAEKEPYGINSFYCNMGPEISL